MRAIKKIGLICATIAFFFSAVVVPAHAYTDGDRIVEYYSFNIKTDERCGCSEKAMKRLFDREWVVTVSNRANNRYGITYGMLWNNATDWSYGLASGTTTRSGTGNFGGKYYNTGTIGMDLYLGALINAADLNKKVSTSGQWSTDAPW